MYRKHSLLISIGFAAAAFLTSVAHAQIQGGPNNAGVPASGGMGRAGIGLGPMGKIYLLNNEKLQQELDLTDEQKAKVAEAVGEASVAISTAMKKNFTSLPRNIGPDERTNKIEQSIKSNQDKSQDKFLKKLEKILLPKQWDRLKQIYLQQQGAMALSEPDVIKTLNVSREQQDRIQVLYDDFRMKLKDATVAQGDGLVKLGGDKLKKMSKELDDNLLDVLSADQRAELEKMKGPKADIGFSSSKMEHGSRGASGVP